MNILNLELLNDASLLEFYRSLGAEIERRDFVLFNSPELNSAEICLVVMNKIVSAVKAYRSRTGLSLLLSHEKVKEFRNRD